MGVENSSEQGPDRLLAAYFVPGRYLRATHRSGRNMRGLDRIFPLVLTTGPHRGISIYIVLAAPACLYMKRRVQAIAGDLTYGHLWLTLDCAAVSCS